MWPLLVVVPHELGQHRQQMLLVEDDEVVETFSAQSPDHSLRDGVRLWRVNRRGDGVDAGLGRVSVVYGWQRGSRGVECCAGRRVGWSRMRGRTAALARAGGSLAWGGGGGGVRAWTRTRGASYKKNIKATFLGSYL